MPVPWVAAIEDLSCVGRCALTVAMPVLSAMGCQCCPLPTALLSTHTGFSNGYFLDLTEPLEGIAAHWEALEVSFNAIYTGFLGITKGRYPGDLRPGDGRSRKGVPHV